MSLVSYALPYVPCLVYLALCALSCVPCLMCLVSCTLSRVPSVPKELTTSGPLSPPHFQAALTALMPISSPYILYLHAYIHAHTHAYTHAHTRIHTHACTHTYTYTGGSAASQNSSLSQFMTEEFDLFLHKSVLHQSRSIGMRQELLEHAFQVL